LAPSSAAYKVLYLSSVLLFSKGLRNNFQEGEGLKNGHQEANNWVIPPSPKAMSSVVAPLLNWEK